MIIFLFVSIFNYYNNSSYHPPYAKLETMYFNSSLIVHGTQTFNADTSFSSIVIESDGVLILNGTVSAQSLLIKTGGRLTHDIRNLTGITLNVDSSVVIEIGGEIDVTRKGLLGGNGGQDGETYDSSGEIERGTSHGNQIGLGYGGAGASHGGIGGSTNIGTVLLAPAYGDMVTPDLLGSGGGGSPCGSCEGRGGTGGGKVYIVCDSFNNNGIIRANGGDGIKTQQLNPAGGAGSGGSIWIKSRVLTGNGMIKADGGNAIQGFYAAGSGGGGRIAIYADTIDFPLENITCFGGFYISNSTSIASAGTIFLKTNQFPNGYLIIKNINNINNLPAIAPTPLLSSSNNFDKVFVSGKSELLVNQAGTNNTDLNVSDSIILNNGSFLIDKNIHLNKNLNQSIGIKLINQSRLTIDTSCTINTTSLIISASVVEIASEISLASPSNLKIIDNGYLYVKNTGKIQLDEFSANNVQNGTVNVAPNAIIEILNNSIAVGPGVRLVKDGKFGSNDYITNLTIQNLGTLLHSDRLESGTVINASKINVEAGGSIDVENRGLRGGDGSSVFEKFGETYSATGQIIPNKGSGGYTPNGASHGGHGGLGNDNDELNDTYGDKFNPVLLGSGGNGFLVAGIQCGAGGGRITIESDTMIVNGIISANGGSAFRGPNAFVDWGAGGSGGSILINTDIINGQGLIKADGGKGLRFNGNGGGGRIAIYTNGGDFSIDQITVTSPPPNDNKGEDGTIVFDKPASPPIVSVQIYQRSVYRAGTTQTIAIDIINNGGSGALDIFALIDLDKWQPKQKIKIYNEDGELENSYNVDSTIVGNSLVSKVPLYIPRLNRFSKKRIIVEVVAQNGLIPHSLIGCSVQIKGENDNAFSVFNGDTSYFESSNIYNLLNQVLDSINPSINISPIPDLYSFLLNYADSDKVQNIQFILRNYLSEELYHDQISSVQKKMIFELILNYIESFDYDEADFLEDSISPSLQQLVARSADISSNCKINKPCNPICAGDANSGLDLVRFTSQFPLNLSVPAALKGIVCEKRLLTATINKKTKKVIESIEDKIKKGKYYGYCTDCLGKKIYFNLHQGLDITPRDIQVKKPGTNEPLIPKNVLDDWYEGNTPVYPIVPGIVTWAGKQNTTAIIQVCVKNLDGQGNDGKIEVCYEHLVDEALPVKKGDIVGYNSILGHVGNSGTTGVHLHLEANCDGKLIDPKCLFPLNAYAPGVNDWRNTRGDWKDEGEEELKKNCRSTGGSTEFLQSGDPNAIVGPEGIGPKRYITGENKLNYTIFYENMPDASLSARQVHLCDTIDLNKFDISTLEFGEIAIGNKTFNLPSVTQKDQEYIIPREQGDSFRIKINVSVDTVKGVIHWIMNTIDTLTMDPPEDPLIGFLPPNKNAPEGDGYVNISIKAKSGLASGTELSNSALIIFDENASMMTNVWTNVIDNAPPLTKIIAPDSPILDTSVVLKWQGSDDGCGIQYIKIYESISNNSPGAFNLLLDSLTTDSFRISLQPGYTYSLYSQGVDSLGNTEPLKSIADVTLFIQFTPVFQCQAILGGVYFADGDTMSSALNTMGFLPTKCPYDTTIVLDPFPATMVDWVRLDLVDTLSGDTTYASQCACLLKDGSINNTNGDSTITFTGVTSPFISLRIKHRNHLSARTRGIANKSGVIISFDFRLGTNLYIDPSINSSSTYNNVGLPEFFIPSGGSHPARFTLWPGDANGDGQVKYQGSGNDRAIILTAIGGTTITNTLAGYHPADITLNGQVKYQGSGNDRASVLSSIGGTNISKVSKAHD